MSRTIIAEHLFYLAGEDPFELPWSDPEALAVLPNIHEATVVSAEDLTPHMRRVKFACADVTTSIGGDMHVRLLVAPKGRAPVWPGLCADGRVAWPEGEDELLVRVYTIRAVDIESREVWIDFLQYPTPGVATPGADFAREAEPGQKVPAGSWRRQSPGSAIHSSCRRRKRTSGHCPVSPRRCRRARGCRRSSKSSTRRRSSRFPRPVLQTSAGCIATLILTVQSRSRRGSEEGNRIPGRGHVRLVRLRKGGRALYPRAPEGSPAREEHVCRLVLGAGSRLM